LATISYMGIIWCPSKSDYFPGDRSNHLPVHPLIKLSKTTFEYLWRWFHTSYKEGDADDAEVSDDGDLEDKEIVEEQTPLPTNNWNDTSKEDDENVPPYAPEPSWYTSIQEFIKHVNKVSQKLC
jgi:hypothetical protein